MATASTLAPATFKQPSRKGKKAWRKNVDITEVQQGLEDVRDEIIKGGVIAEKSSEDLFIVDTAGDAEVEKQQRGQKLLRADEIIAVRSAVSGLDGRKRKATEIAEKASKRQKDGKYVSKREVERLKRAADTMTALQIEDTNAGHDPWGAAPPVEYAELEWVPKPQPIREPASIRKAPTALTAHGRAVSAVPKPQGGKSYNPHVDEWSALLEKEGAAAVQTELARLAAIEADEAKQAQIEAEIAKVEAKEQNERDDAATDYESEWDGIMSESEKVTYTAKPQKRKTQAQRNKQRARREREALEVQARNQKAREIQQDRVKQIAREMSIRDKARQRVKVDIVESSDSEEDPELVKRRFGRPAVPSGPLEVVLPDELEDSLRRLKPEGDLLMDRYRNHLINGHLEVRKRRVMGKKPKKSRTEKWTYKDWTLK